MSATATFLSPNEANRLLSGTPWGRSNKQNSSPASARDLRSIAMRLDKLAVAVQHDWVNFPEELKQGLINLVYMGPKHMTVARKVQAAIEASVSYIRDPNGLLVFIAARNRVVDAVLTVIEEENEDFQSQLHSLLGDLELNEMVGAPLEPGQEREYLRNL